jgi:hypothetical protein
MILMRRYCILVYQSNRYFYTNLLVERLNKSFQTLLQKHQALKTQNDEILVRVGLEQHFALTPALKGKQIEEDGKRAGIGRASGHGEEDSREGVGLVGVTR